MSNPQQPAKMWSGRFHKPLARASTPWPRSVTRLLPQLILLALTPVLLHAQAPAPAPQPKPPEIALVTFFAQPFPVSDPSLDPTEGPWGKLFVDHDQLAFIGPAQFMTVQFLPGHYQFSATMGTIIGIMGGAHIEMDLAAGKHYFVERLNNQWYPVKKLFIIKEVQCADTKSIASKMRPVETKNLKKAARGNVVTETSFPQCP